MQERDNTGQMIYQQPKRSTGSTLTSTRLEQWFWKTTDIWTGQAAVMKVTVVGEINKWIGPMMLKRLELFKSSFSTIHTSQSNFMDYNYIIAHWITNATRSLSPFTPALSLSSVHVISSLVLRYTVKLSYMVWSLLCHTTLSLSYYMLMWFTTWRFQSYQSDSVYKYYVSMPCCFLHCRKLGQFLL